MPPDRSELVALVESPADFLTASDPILRRLAVTALNVEASPGMHATLGQLALDTDAAVRTAVAEKLGSVGARALPDLEPLRYDKAETVREAVATAYGEIADPTVLEWLVEASANDSDRAVREAAVASIGAIGDPRAIDHLLDLLSQGPPPVRRRTIAALTVFDDARIEPAIQRAAFDRNPGVREAAEMVVGRQLGPDGSRE